ncbi:hypothetical protein BgiMline_007107 [Biomphalaria glabrata]|nr:hypothetical protein BgiMline_022696 [Biomphalaria glabrata]
MLASRHRRQSTGCMSSCCTQGRDTCWVSVMPDKCDANAGMSNGWNTKGHGRGVVSRQGNSDQTSKLLMDKLTWPEPQNGPSRPERTSRGGVWRRWTQGSSDQIALSTGQFFGEGEKSCPENKKGGRARGPVTATSGGAKCYLPRDKMVNAFHLCSAKGKVTL